MNRIISANVLALSVASLICTAGFTQSPTNPRDPNRPNQPSTQQPRTTTGGNMARGGLDALEGRWNVTMRITGMGGAPEEIRGNATRTWMLDESVLREDFRVTGTTRETGTGTGTGTDTDTTGRDPDRDTPGRDVNTPPGQQPGSQTGNEPPADRTGTDTGADTADDRNPDRQVDPSLSDITSDFEGLGLFAFDPANNEVSHVWADSMSRGMVLSIGRFDPSTRTMTFTQHAGNLDKPKSGESTGAVIGTGTGSSGAQDDPDQDRPGQDIDKPSTARPGSATVTGAAPVVTLRIVSDTQHVVTMTKPNRGGQARTYEITYTKQGATGTGTGTDTNMNRDRNRP